jgi:anti-anti-sigma factor
MSLQIERREAKGSAITLEVIGILDYATIGIFHTGLPELKGYSSILIDCTRLEFTDSTGIGAILEVMHMAHEHNLHFEIIGLSEEVEAIFETMGVFQIIEALQGRS